MIVPKKLTQVKLKKEEAEVTGKMGLSWIYHCMKHYGVEDMIDKICPRESSSNREIRASRKVLTGVLTRIAGGDRIEDIENLRADKALLDTLRWESMISPDTLREFLMIDENRGRIKNINADMARKVMRDSEVQEFTYDNDATYFDSEKESAKYSYKGRKQFSGLLGFIEEIGICNTIDFRPGDVYPGKGVYEQLTEAIKQTESVGKRIIRFRSDSVAHSNRIFNKCNEERIEYYITLDKNEAVRKCITTLREEDWHKMEGKYKEKKDRQWAETVYVTEEGVGMRILVIRWPNYQRDLFKRDKYCYHVIATNNNEVEPMMWLEIHNQRMGSENCNKELKSGFNVNYMPSHDFRMNENYFLLGIIAYNVVEIMKLFYLGKESRRWTIKTLRYRFIYACGKITRTGRRYFCKIINVTQETFDLFKRCLSRLIVAT